MRTLLAATLLFGLTACTNGQDDPKKGDDKKPPAVPGSLKVGDPAPPLTVQKWLNGGEVKGFELGKVYVLDFWATWCGPCIEAMPHLAELQAEFGNDLKVAAVTTVTRKNPEDAVEKFVARQGPKLGLPFAVCTTDDMEKNWFDASGQNGIPASFVVDKAGKIAFIGHPMELDDVLPKVIAGTWKGAADVAAIEKLSEELAAIYERGEDKPAEAVVALDALLAKHPEKAAQASVQVHRVRLLLGARKADEAKAVTEKLLPGLTAKKQVTRLGNLLALWVSKEYNPDRKHTGLAVQAADGILAAEGDKSPLALFGAAEANFAAGNGPKAVELAEKSLAVAENDEEKAFIKERIAVFKGK